MHTVTKILILVCYQQNCKLLSISSAVSKEIDLVQICDQFSLLHARFIPGRIEDLLKGNGIHIEWLHLHFVVSPEASLDEVARDSIVVVPVHSKLVWMNLPVCHLRHNIPHH